MAAALTVAGPAGGPKLGPEWNRAVRRITKDLIQLRAAGYPVFPDDDRSFASLATLTPPTPSSGAGSGSGAGAGSSAPAVPELEPEIDIRCWRTCVFGPKDTPYEGGVWPVRMTFTHEFPIKSMSVGVLGGIMHPNIDESSGSVCCDALGKEWSSITSVLAVADIIMPALLSNPNPDDPLAPEHAISMKRNRAAYEASVRKSTNAHIQRIGRLGGSIEDTSGGGGGGSGEVSTSTTSAETAASGARPVASTGGSTGPRRRRN